MLIAGIVVLCIFLLVLAFLLPNLSKGPERASESALHRGGGVAGKAPGKLGEWLSKPFHKGARAAGKSASTGRKARRHTPV